MSSERASWELVLAAARWLGAGHRDVALTALLEEVRRLGPGRDPDAILLVIQGMTGPAPGAGPRSPCGTPLRQVAPQVYRLSADVTVDDVVPVTLVAVPADRTR
jgi:hypothetical protein